MMVSIKKEIKSAFSENRNIIIASAAIFFIALILGYLFQPALYSYFNPLVEDLSDKVRSGVIKLTFQDIFLNNIMIVLRMFILGVFFFISPLILAFNGFFAGYFISSAPNLTYALVLIIPHAIFEFPSCILGCASGLVLFKFVYNLIKTFKREKGMKFSGRIVNAYSENFNILLQAFILLIVSSVLMIVAGIVEVYITVPVGMQIMSILS